jgi:DNA-binding beta-propeller fold protein YncE
MNYRVQYFTRTGLFLGKWGSQGTGDGQFEGLTGLAIAPNGNVYTADAGPPTGNHRIQYFSPSGSFLGEWGSKGTGNGEFDDPYGLAVALNGNVYVADVNNHRIQYFTSNGSFLGKWGSQGTGDGQFYYPTGITITPNGYVFVADLANHRVQHFTPTGSFLGKFGSRGSGNGEFERPVDVALSPDGTRVYVVDTDNHRIQYFREAPTNIVPSSVGRIKALFR